MKYRFFFCFFILASIVIFKGCSDDTVQTTAGNTDPGIYMTDEFGNFLGGDTTDWCLQSDTGMSLSFRYGAAYPNPTNGRRVHIQFQIPQIDTVKLYFLNGTNDSTVFVNQRVQPGTYMFTIDDSLNQYANSYRRLYFSSKRYTASQFCRFYGDIKFTP